MDQQATLHARFEYHAQADPDRPAVVAAGETVSYQDLNERANRIAWRLRELGVGRGMMVGISVDRSADMLAGLLAILKSGGAYVPLDPDYPADRLTLMIEDTAAPVIVCNRRTAPLLPPHGAAVVLLDEPGAFDAFPTDNVTGPATADDLAYVIYTSGSTGRPKGVLVTHDSVVNLVTDQTYVSITADDRVAALATLAFDASTFELWAPLTNGATCVLYEFAGDDLTGLVEKVQRDKVTVLNLTSPVFRLLEPGQFEALASVHTIQFGGDSVRFDIGVRARESFAGKLIHLYGPTETTGFATFFDLATIPEPAPNVPIGRPIRNVHVLVVDEDGRPVPDGTAGELLIGGRGVARGYLNRPEITAERFVSAPDAGPDARRYYRSGDLVRTTPGGTLQFLGRLDRQIKVRGYRIEPGEIESALTMHPDVRDAVVVAREDGTGDKRLDAYLVPAEPALLVDRRSLAAVRAHVRETLPSYQHPATYTVIETVPLTDNLKLDQDRLPAPVVERDAVAGLTGPVTELEGMLTTLWCDTFGLDGIGPDDNFFDLGGDSLLAVHLAAVLTKATGRPVTVKDVFRHPTIRQLAQAVL